SASAGRLSNEQLPFSSALTGPSGSPSTSTTGLPSGPTSSRQTPGIPGSPSSCLPSLSLSYQTRSPTETRLTITPASHVGSMPSEARTSPNSYASFATRNRLDPSSVNRSVRPDGRVAFESADVSSPSRTSVNE